MTKKLASFNQRYTLASLQKQVGLDKYDEIKSKLKITKPPYEMSQGQAGLFLQALIDYIRGSKTKKPPITTNAPDNYIKDMRAALGRIQDYVRTKGRVAKPRKRNRSR